ncbi:AglZ/HisF2 family acetamidino modification protein [Citromicrobium bathyomarinum]|jgi:imidazole glycerol-phosphate synthase subunit HisF|uniref:Imidazole glycerol phosphate synthase subunit HisF n=1 Tax=Alteriqipengyuania abyssalis TaxID=2860200 RepID=A0ABS7PC49_9SPHN|nr:MULTISPECIES: AglZ/HisF2 family acetamidino modification protein [Sphingomonadales]MAO05726.1 imidazole glycerol phosphate synthase cyclase subunit [Citromicrobium sp.]KPM12117.1 imidazole glycerol phosphate synthase [Citromicrobium sp. WPS32]KPM12143.1 imidazole glycerol phosphate synthase [Citromicrobium sp. JL1351]KPM12484.1 imidazole glycerol phosphate synthase [Citromicrobium sp. JL31]KPM20050.1 imidazole glycerol phosphate synthase [Citromicrobium sp. JL2201]|tara:strand:- start:7326 stop:8117 length:792 start_codon:yes stop_codon:yes gene_type:complete
MLRPRIIPCLLVHEGGLVKTVGFGNPKYVGDPINAVKIFNEKESDELIVVDIDASVTGAEPDFQMIAHLAAECRMPLCYGGGVKTAAQAKRIVSLGVEKVAVSAAAAERPALIGEMANEVGRQSVVTVIDYKKRRLRGGYEMVTHNATRNAKRDPVEFAIEAEAQGAGEIVLNSVDNDGKMTGYDLTLAKQLREKVDVPITILGGAGSLDDIAEAIREMGIIGLAAGSLFVFKGKLRAVLISYPQPDAKEQLIRDAMAARGQA